MSFTTGSWLPPRYRVIPLTDTLELTLLLLFPLLSRPPKTMYDAHKHKVGKGHKELKII